MHVYFQARVEGIRHVDNGELRGSRCYCLLPPSVHPDGPTYEWVNPISNGNLLAVDPELAGFLPGVTGQLEQSEQSEQSDAMYEDEKVVEIDKSVEQIIEETLPRTVRTRNRQVWDFIRTLKADPRFAGGDPLQFRPIVQLWHDKAKPYIRTQDFTETWIDFLYGWDRVILPKGEDPMGQIFQKAKNKPLPEAAKRFDKPKVQLLVSWCRELQLAAGRYPFHLSARTAGRYLDVDAMTAWRYLYLLVRERVLDEIEKGGTKRRPKRATRFRYIAN
jgi:hypothetical protein